LYKEFIIFINRIHTQLTQLFKWKTKTTQVIIYLVLARKQAHAVIATQSGLALWKALSRTVRFSTRTPYTSASLSRTPYTFAAHTHFLHFCCTLISHRKD